MQPRRSQYGESTANVWNQRGLYCMRTENLDWNNRIIFVPDRKTADGRRMIPMSDGVYELLRVRAEGKGEGWLFPSNGSKCGHLTDLGKAVSHGACEDRTC